MHYSNEPCDLLKNITANLKTKQKSNRCIGVGQNDWNWKCCKVTNECVELQEE